MAKDKKAKTAEKKLRVAQKNEKKAAQKEKKASTKKPRDAIDDSDADDDDIDAVLAAYAAQQEQFLKVTETVSEPPSARASSTLTASPANSRELFLFGGEYFNGSTARFYNELHVYNILRDEWRLVTSPNSPLPRSGHAWTRGGNTGGIYLFGGEFSSPKQGTFYHYSDFWRLDPSSREWTKLEHTGKSGGSKTPQAPSARSGHRMTYFKNYIILFGGFQDTSSSTRYLNDLWLYDCNTFSWHSPVLPPASGRPEARSSFTFLPRDDGAVLYGGYSRVKTSTTSKGAGGGKASKGGPAQAHAVLKPLVHQDAWYLRITPAAAEAPAGALPTVRWERRKRPVNAPQPARAGATMAFHRGRGIQFGGVHDVENSEEGIESDFYNTLYVWNIERNRFFSLALRRPRAGAKRATAQVERARRGRGKADEEELLANLKALEMREGLAGDVGDEEDDEEGEEEVEAKIEKPVFWEMPHPRFNAQLTVQDDVLYIFGGTFEKADREYTFDEMWSIDLSSLAGVKQHFKRELEDWQGSESESEEDEDDEEEDGDGSDDDLVNNTESTAKNLEDSTATSEADHDPSEVDISTDDTSVGEAADDRPHPRPFESLRDFYARTSLQWQEILLQELKYDGGPSGKSIKEVRKSAFSIAESKWWDCREEIQALEDEQEEAGIGEVVNLAEKAADVSSGVGRRR